MTGNAEDPVPAADLGSILTGLWSALCGAVEGRNPALRQGVLATQSVDGPQARHVVLRAACRKRSMLEFHTDLGSVKCGELALDPRVCWCFYEHPLQLRMSGRARVQADGAARAAAWRGLGRYSRCEYLPHALDQAAAADETPPANFGLYRVEVQHIDWLRLDRSGHQRAGFTRATSGLWSGRWLDC